jgi:hypothetical protein
MRMPIFDCFEARFDVLKPVSPQLGSPCIAWVAVEAVDIQEEA